MKIGIAVKWTATAVLLVVLVVGIYAFMTIRDVSQSVEEQTNNLSEIQQDALNRIGSSTTSYLGLPASSLMYDNDLSGLEGLLQPVVAEGENSSVFAAVIAQDGRIWTRKAASEIKQIVLPNEDILFLSNDDTSDPKQLITFNEDYLNKFEKAQKSSTSMDLELNITKLDDTTSKQRIRQFVSSIKDRNDKLQGYILIGYSLEKMDTALAGIKEAGEVNKQETLNRSLFLAILAIIVGIVIAVLQSITISRNIKSLATVAGQIADGDLSVRTNIKTSDEIGQLGTQFNVMADKVQLLLAETEQKAMLEKELDIARSIQETLLPSDTQAQFPHARISGYFKPASECGGDFWSYNAFPDGSILITIGDVTGHGVPSAMITAVAKSALDTLLNISGNQIALTQIVTELNKTIYDTAKRSLFMTFLALRINPTGSEVEVVNAGHNFPLYINRAQNADVKGLVVRGNRLGDSRTSVYESLKCRINKGDFIMLYTDGITEYLDLKGREYGEKRLRKVFSELVHQNLDGNSIVSHVLGDLSQFCGTAAQADDITMAVVQAV